jgi:hypothetical protein
MFMLAVIAAAVIHTSTLQLSMAGNHQLVEEALQQAQAIADELTSDVDNFSLQGNVGDRNCAQYMSEPECTKTQLRPPESAVDTEAFALTYRVIRREPLVWSGFPMRESQSVVSSSRSFNAALFEVDVRIDGAAAQLGSARVVQGVAIRVPAVD